MIAHHYPPIAYAFDFDWLLLVGCGWQERGSSSAAALHFLLPLPVARCLCTMVATKRSDTNVHAHAPTDADAKKTKTPPSKCRADAHAHAHAVAVGPTTTTTTLTLQADFWEGLRSMQAMTQTFMESTQLFMGVTAQKISALEVTSASTERKVDDLAQEVRDLKQGLRLHKTDMDCGLDHIERYQNLSQVFDFIGRYGMDTRTGYVVAFPVFIGDRLYVALSLHLLHYALFALMPRYARGVASFTLAGLKTLMSLIKSHAFGHVKILELTRLLAVEPYAGTAQRQASNNIHAWRIYEPSVFIAAIRKAQQCAGNFVEVECTPDSLSADFWSTKRRQMFCNHFTSLPTRMAWGHEVQAEVLDSPAVAAFFDLVKAQADAQADEAEAEVQAEAKAVAPFHFCGLTPDPTHPVRSHATLRVAATATLTDTAALQMETELGDEETESESALASETAEEARPRKMVVV